MNNNTNNHFIYRYESPSGKSYIGQTFGDDIERALRIRSCGSNGYGYKGCIKFYNAIKKYGFDKFNVEILFYGLSQADANRIEVICISLFRSVEFGYNTTPGGGGYNKGKNSHSKEYQNEYRRKRYQAMTSEERKLYNQTHKVKPKKRQEISKQWLTEHPSIDYNIKMKHLRKGLHRAKLPETKERYRTQIDELRLSHLALTPPPC